jgi:hypothetical protein
MYGLRLNKSDTFFFVCDVTNCCVSFLSFRETVQTEAFVLKKVSWILWRKLNGTINFERKIVVDVIYANVVMYAA